MDDRLKGHLPVLDGVRGVAILLVALFHTELPETIGRLELGVAMAKGFGWSGVDLFFVLSGFLITGILLDARGSDRYYRAFYIRRALRIFPLYFGYCAILFLLLPLLHGWGSPAAERVYDAAPWYLAYVMNVRIALEGSWGAALSGTAMFWSLCVEEQFYLLWPWVVRRFEPGRLIRLCLWMIVAALGVRLYAVLSAENLFAAYVLLPARMDSLAAGALVAAMVRTPGGLDRLTRWTPLVLTLAGFGILGLVRQSGYTGWDHPLMATVGYSLVALVYASLLVLLLVARPAAWAHRAMTSGTLRFCGKYSYGMYLLGGTGGALIALTPLSSLVPTRIAGSVLPSMALTFMIHLAATVGLALISWHLLEARFLSLKSRFPYATRGPAPVVSAALATAAPVAVPSEVVTPGTVVADGVKLADRTPPIG